MPMTQTQQNWAHLQHGAEIVQVLQDDVRIGIFGDADQPARLAFERRRRGLLSQALLEEKERDQPLHPRLELGRRRAEVQRCADHQRIGLDHPVEDGGSIVRRGAVEGMRRTVGCALHAARVDVLVGDVDYVRFQAWREGAHLVDDARHQRVCVAILAHRADDP
jgi:hypothetical protein